MAEIRITINEDDIAKEVEKQIAERMTASYCAENRDTKYGIRKGVENAVKAYVYAQKDEIIERCVTRAADSLVRKGLPKLVERLGSCDEKDGESNGRA